MGLLAYCIRAWMRLPSQLLPGFQHNWRPPINCRQGWSQLQRKIVAEYCLYGHCLPCRLCNMHHPSCPPLLSTLIGIGHISPNFHQTEVVHTNNTLFLVGNAPARWVRFFFFFLVHVRISMYQYQNLKPAT